MYKCTKVKLISYTLGKLHIQGSGEVVPFKSMRFQKTTQENLDILKKAYGINWSTVHKFNILQKTHYRFITRIAISFLITGVDFAGNVYTYWRKELYNPQSGQTRLYLNGSKPVAATALINSYRVLQRRQVPSEWRTTFKI